MIRKSVHSSATSEGDLGTEEKGLWYYLVTDASGIRPRADAAYSKESKRGDLRFTVGTVVAIDRRRRSGWTRWLSAASGEGWLFDVSPKDRKVRMVEVEVQTGTWEYEVCVDGTPVLARPHQGAPVSCNLRVGDAVTAVERVRPLSGRGVFLRLMEISGWVLDFAGGVQTVRRRVRMDDTELPSSPLKDPTAVLAQPEIGHWRYVVLDPKGMTLRSKPTYDKTEKLETRVEEGEIVDVVERRVGPDTSFLRADLSGHSGWLFDVQPGSGSHMRLLEVQVEDGSWYYQVVADRGCALRSRCSARDSSKVSKGPDKGSLVKICQRVKVGQITFLHLSDGSGWLFDMKADGRPMLEGPIDVQGTTGETATVIQSGGVTLLQAPTAEPWAATKMVVLQHSTVQIGLRAHLKGVLWVQVSKPGGMTGWVAAGALEFDSAISSRPVWAR